MRHFALVILLASLSSASMVLGCGAGEDNLAYDRKSTSAVEAICLGPEGLTSRVTRLYGGVGNITTLLNGPVGTLWGFSPQGDVYGLQIAPDGLSEQGGFKVGGFPFYNPGDGDGVSFRFPDAGTITKLQFLAGGSAIQNTVTMPAKDPHAKCAGIYHTIHGFEICWDELDDSMVVPGSTTLPATPDYSNTNSFFGKSGIVSVAIFGDTLAILSVKSDGSFQVGTLTIDQWGRETSQVLETGGIPATGQDTPTSIAIGRNGVYLNGRGAIWMWLFSQKRWITVSDVPPGDRVDALLVLQ